MTIKQLKEKLKITNENYEVNDDLCSLIINYRKRYTNEKIQLLKAKYDESVVSWIVHVNKIAFTQEQTYLLAVPLKLIACLDDPTMIEKRSYLRADKSKRNLYESDSLIND